MDIIYYFLLLMIVIAIVSFSVWAWYYTFADLLARKKLIDNDNDKNEF